MISRDWSFENQKINGWFGDVRGWASWDGVSCVQRRSSCGLHVVSWNLLAREFTWHNTAHHGGYVYEDMAHTKLRFQLAAEKMLEWNADVFLLQECSSLFFDDQWNTWASILRKHYILFRTFLYCRNVQYQALLSW